MTYAVSGRVARCSLVILLILVGWDATAIAGSVAVTFDDLPIFGNYAPIPEAEHITAELLAGSRRHGWRATGFVNEIQLEGVDRQQRIGLLSRWLDAGMNLGNHSYSHLSLNKTPVDVYINDVARGQEVTSELLAARHRRERWYRYPYLETGVTVDVRRKFEGWLASHGYRVAPVTMENSDWEFAEPYDDALARADQAEAEHVRESYIAFTAKIIPWYRLAATGLLGREPAFVLLLHASRLNADCIDDLAAILSGNGLTPVSLDVAMKDPAYRIRDSYVGPDGDEWVTRWALTLHRDLPYASLPTVPADIAALDEKVEAVQGGAAAVTK